MPPPGTPTPGTLGGVISISPLGKGHWHAEDWTLMLGPGGSARPPIPLAAADSNLRDTNRDRDSFKEEARFLEWPVEILIGSSKGEIVSVARGR